MRLADSPDAAEMSTRLFSSLKRHGVHTVDDARALPLADFAAWVQVGQKQIDELAAWQGLASIPAPPPPSQRGRRAS